MMKRHIFWPIFILLSICCADLCLAGTFQPEQISDTAAVYNIKEFGAVGDGVTINTEPINRAIDACASSGGGTILVPEGKFVTGTILLQSNVTLYLENNATIVGTNDTRLYKSFNFRKENPDRPIHLPIKGNSVWSRSLILVDNVQNVTITGTGTIDGGTVIDKQGEEGFRGPHGILIGESSNVKISGVRISRSGNYNILGANIEDVELSNLTITEGSDGIHIRGGKNIQIENCKIYTSDDAIAGGYWENVQISECLINSSCNGVRLILPATNLEIKDCEISGPGVFGHRRGSLNNPLVTNSLTGIIMQPGAWGIGHGNLEQIFIHDIRIRDVQTALTIVLNEGNNGNDIRVENVTATGIYRNACSVEAWPEGSRFKNVLFKNVSIAYHVNDKDILTTTAFDRPRTESRPLPFWGFYVRNVKNITFENVRLDYTGNEVRPMMGFDKVDSVFLDGMSYRVVPGVEAIRYSGYTKVRNLNSKPFN
ncbi:glycoside hydrolase family 28 protein [Seramator thermalis]|uniref:glycoside hydrolase family 28 protein n=1 Tax=Seramator thermalis TaxID=2496270 RepID=UPI00101B635C|nr:glycosyl hydrolase family 28-related protein [Seramator thermalis]